MNLDELKKNEGLVFILTFLGTFLLFYYFNLFFISLTARASSPFTLFIKENLNYVDWLRTSILHTGAMLSNLFGVKSHAEGKFLLRADMSRSTLRMGYTCIGLGVMSFWAAFVIANRASLFNKIKWLLGGLVVIWIINCFRLAVLLYALVHHWAVSKYVDHHTMFNIIAYMFLGLLIYAYIKLNKPKQQSS